MKKRICFVAHDAFRELADPTAGAAGGIQRQQSFMARWLAARDYPVSMITWDEGQSQGMMIDGVRVITICRRDAGLPGLRFFHPRWTSLIAALRRADADLYYHNSAEYVTGQVALWCQLAGRRFVYSVASDPACDANLRVMPTRRERELYRYGIRRADTIITQTRAQQERLLSNFGVTSRVLPMPCPGPSLDDRIPRPRPSVGLPRALWVGRIAQMKRPDMLLAVADAMPELAFDLVGEADQDRSYAAAVLAKARLRANVTVHGRVGRDGLAKLYGQASVLCCTSTYEGFPNTFLEAWSHGVPVVSTIDPDGLIAALELGETGRDAPGLVAAIRNVLASRERWSQLSTNCRRHYLENYTPDLAMAQFEGAFRELLSTAPDTRQAEAARQPL
jgi:glycosyltransferase involved in cell wall biosynthesis